MIPTLALLALALIMTGCEQLKREAGVLLPEKHVCHWNKAGSKWNLISNSDGKLEVEIMTFPSIDPGMFQVSQNGYLYEEYDTLNMAQTKAITRTNCRLDERP